MDDPQVVLAGTGSPWFRKKPASLAKATWVLPPPGTAYGAVVADAFKAAGVGPPKAAVSSTLPVREPLVATGRFLSLAPRVGPRRFLHCRDVLQGPLSICF